MLTYGKIFISGLPWQAIGALAVSFIIVMLATYCIVEADNVRTFWWCALHGHWHFDWHRDWSFGYLTDWYDGPIYQLSLGWFTIAITAG